MGLNEQQQKVVNHRDGELLVAAAAGSGKTFVLVERLLSRILPEEGEPLSITDFVVITFTKDAAGELKQRIAKELHRRLAEDYSNSHLRRQLTLVYQAKISTIHSFCTDLLREYGHLIEINPSFGMLSKEGTLLLKQQVLASLLEDYYGEEEAHPRFPALIRCLSPGNSDKELEEIVLRLHNSIQSHPDPKAWLTEEIHRWEQVEQLVLEESIWGQVILEDFWKECQQAVRELEESIEIAGTCPLVEEVFTEDLEKVQEEMEIFARGVEELWKKQEHPASTLTWDSLVEKQKQFHRKEKFPRRIASKGSDKLVLDEMKAKREKAYARVSQFDLFGSQEMVREDLSSLKPIVLELIGLLQDFTQRFQLSKLQRNQLDFQDLEHYTVKLLVNPQGEPTELAKIYGENLAEMMLDEYQDTNRVQNAIFNALTQGGHKLFMVGDMKQAIYRFRLADPSIFSGKFSSYAKEGEAGSRRVLTLDANYRSRSQVLETCNDFFNQMMTHEFGEVDYLQDGQLVKGAEFPSDTCPSDYYDTELFVIDLENYQTQQKAQGFVKENSYFLEARWVARKIRSMVEEGFQIMDETTKELRKLRYSDVMILSRQGKSISSEYFLAMEEAGVPLYQKLGEGIFDTVEVSVAYALLQVLNNPSLDIPLLSLLRSPLFAFSPDDLALLKASGAGSYFDRLFFLGKAEISSFPQEEVEIWEKLQEKVLKFQDFYHKYRQLSLELSPGRLLWALYQDFHMLALYSAMAPGERRKENLLEFYQIVSSLEGSLYQCLSHLQRLQEVGELPKKVNRQNEGETVVMHTIHSSKGLEKPLVFLVGLMKEFNLRDTQATVLFHPQYGLATQQFQEDQQKKTNTFLRQGLSIKIKEESISEELRLLYVAMTRAREKLLLVTTADKASNLLGNLRKEASLPFPATVLYSKKSLGELVLSYYVSREENMEEVLAKGEQGRIALNSQVPCQMHYIPYEDEGEVSLSPLDFQEEAEFGTLAEDCDRWYQWKYPYQAEVDTPSKMTASQTKTLTLVEEEESPPIPSLAPSFEPRRIPSFAVEKKALSYAQQGTAIHLMMEYIDIGRHGFQSEAEIELFKENLVKEKKLSQEQSEVIPSSQIFSFLQSDLGKRARKAQKCAQEFRFSLLVPACDLGCESREEILLQGVVDCWFEEEDGIVLLDFKSDKVKEEELAKKAKEHGNQMRVYRSALTRILKKPVKETVLWFFKLNQGVTVPEGE